MDTKDKYSGKISAGDNEDTGNWDSNELENVLELDNIKLLRNGPGNEQENEEEDGPKHTLSRFIAFAVLFAVVLLLALMAYMKSAGIELSEVTFSEAISRIFSKSPVSSGENTMAIGYDIKQETLLGASQDTILKYDGSRIHGIDSKGKVKWEVPFTGIDLIGAADGEYAAVADSSGRNFCLIKDGSLVSEGRVSGSIINLALNSNGYSAVIYKSEGSKGSVTVFDPQGSEIFTRTFANRYVMDAEISPDNREILISIIDISGVNAYSSFEITDVFGTFKSGIVPKKQDMFPFFWFLGGDAVAIAGDKEVVLFNRDGSEIWSASFRKVFSATVLQNQYIAAAVSQSTDSESYIEVWDKSGRRFKSETLGEGVVNIRSFDDIIAVNTGREVIFMNSRCELLDTYSPTADILDIQVLNRREIAVITRNSINIFDLGVVR